MGKIVEGTAADGHRLSMYRADPAGERRGALVVVQEIFGVNGHIRSVCDDYAGQGYVVIAPALFDRVERGIELGYGPEDVTRGRALREKVSLDQALADVEAAAKEVAAHGKIGVIGYCWGGTVAWVAATRSRTFAAAVSYYGGGVPDLAQEQPNCPVLLHFGDQDQSIPLAGVEKVKAAHPELPVHIYPAGHGFNCDQRASYHAESARLARERTLAFLREHIG
ncbi:MAG TPA: dienelactone hydrolase family protein [Geminicoccaceae bacterium]|nr:dienelactone hydrolase family protein [Geminicoccaceae bacterium]